MTLSAWLLLGLALPVLFAGEWLVFHIKVLSRFNIPAPVVGGLLASTIVLLGNITGVLPISFETKVAAQWWTWLVTIEPEWITSPQKGINMPFMVAFFTCVGLNASWTLVKIGTSKVITFLVLSSILAILQNCIGVALAKLMDAPPLLGLVCGSVTLTGGHGTALGFASEFKKAGLMNADVVGVAAATFGLVAGGLVGGPLGGGLIRRHRLKSAAPVLTHLESGESGRPGLISDLRSLVLTGKSAAANFLILLLCIKLGAWMSYLIQKSGITFPVYIGSMVLGVFLRNLLDLLGLKWIKTEIVDLLGAVSLGFFLSIAMMGLNLVELAATALPMIVILSTQVVMIVAFAWFITFRYMGRDFDAAVICAGQCGFGLGATPNAIANMKALVQSFGPAPNAFLVVPLVGGFLVDLVNATNITVFLNLLR